MNITEQIPFRGMNKQTNNNKYIIISASESGSIMYEFREEIDDKHLLSKIACSENSFDCDDLDKYSEYISTFKKPWDNITTKDFLDSLDNTNHYIKYIIEVNKERVVYRNKK